jgi:glutamate-1-semialdehyde 2,1-aminomutase
VKNLEDAINTSDEMYNIYFDTMLENGIIVPPSKYEAHFISMAHTDEEMKKILEITEKAFDKMTK